MTFAETLLAETEGLCLFTLSRVKMNKENRFPFSRQNKIRFNCLINGLQNPPPSKKKFSKLKVSFYSGSFGWLWFEKHKKCWTVIPLLQFLFTLVQEFSSTHENCSDFNVSDGDLSFKFPFAQCELPILEGGWLIDLREVFSSIRCQIKMLK